MRRLLSGTTCWRVGWSCHQSRRIQCWRERELIDRRLRGFCDCGRVNREYSAMELGWLLSGTICERMTSRR